MKTNSVIGIVASLLFLLIVVRNLYFVEPFQTEAQACSKLTTKTACQAREDCLFDEKTSKCMACSDISDCKLCADTDKCGWCGDVSKCVLLNRFGTPVGRECSAQRTVRFANQCGSKNPNYDVPVSSELLDDTEEDDTYAKATTSTSGGTGSVPSFTGPSCASSDKVAEIAKKKIEDSIKTLVRNELKAQGLSIKEGFTAEEDISKMVVSSLSDDIRKLVKESVTASKSKA